MLKTTTTCDSPPLMCPTSDSDKLADQQEKWNRQQRLGIDAVENLLDDRRQRNVGQRRPDEHARHQ
jgi:hypothetical protein